MSTSIRIPQLARDAQVRAASFDEEALRVDVVWTTGAVVRRRSYAEGEFDEELVVDAKSVRLDRLNAGAPFLNTHDQYDLRGVIGAVVPGTARIEKGLGYAQIQLSRRPEAAGIVQDIRDGVINNISVGYRTHVLERHERKGMVPLFRAIDWEPWEISAVPIPADAGAQFRSDGSAPALHEAAVFHAGGPVGAIGSRMRMRARMLGLGA